ncbi:MAG: fatty acid desaturase [Planctomycetota bacterium]|nr:fatty acid desaturase [Planctomycetota bacterium]
MKRSFHRVVGFCAYYASFFYFLILLPCLDRRETDSRFRERLQRATRCAMAAFGVEINVVGEEHLGDGTNAIIVANHSSWFDQMALVASLDVPVAFVANEKYFRYPGLRTVLRKLGSIPVFGTAVSDSLQKCRQVLSEGKWLVIYPEGTRSSVLQPFRRGAAVLANQTGIATQPIVIHGTEAILPRKHSFLQVEPGVITLEILPRIHKTARQSTHQYMARIEKCFAQRPDLIQYPTSNSSIGKSRNRTTTASGTPPAGSHPVPLTMPDDPATEQLQPSNLVGGFYLLLAVLLTTLSVACALSSQAWIWLAGQLGLAFAMIQWFAILHEAGHKTLFRTSWLNRWSTHTAGFLACIPGDCWRLVHAKHHYWTGWQDLDMTTETLVPRTLRTFERVALNVCWRLWIPLPATLYRLNNYWNLPRLWKIFSRPRERRLIVLNIIGYLVVYLALGTFLGWGFLAQTFGLALLITMSLQDLLILSQHTHIPMKLANKQTDRLDQYTAPPVKPFPPMQQEVFTRSLIFPQWFARLILLNVDAHSLHHMLPRVPGYHLHRLQNQKTANSIRWWKWVIHAKRIPGEILLFQNRDQTGFYF